MPDIQKSLEIERVVNIVNVFGWKKTDEKIDADKVTLIFEKVFVPGAPQE